MHPSTTRNAAGISLGSTPIEANPAWSANQAAGSPGTPVNPGILLLDDDLHMLELQSRMLRNMGYSNVTISSNASDALMKLERNAIPAQVIICDLNMPGMDGIEFLRRLDRSMSRLSVILLSGEGSRILHTVQKLLTGGRIAILGALTKPAGQAALRTLIDRSALTTAPAAVPSRTDVAFTASEMHAANLQRQWVLHYQPKVDLASGALVAMEALVRWQHPQHGLVYPDRFIGLAEECGAIDKMTENVFSQAMKQRAQWQDQGLDIRMAINVSMKSLEAPDYWDRLGALVRRASTSPQHLILEITESRLMSSSSIPLENLVRLRLQRFGLAIDDFGTGHSSLAQLRDVPFSELKIDRGFVSSARNNQIIRPILESSIVLAKRLGMTSVAEGVESEEDWHLLRELGCDQAQGYFIARPMDASRIWEWLNLWKARSPGLVAP